MSALQQPVQERRAAGILLHPTSLPGDFGIGELGSAAERFLDWAGAAGFTTWQVLPLGPTTQGSCNSPYACPSTFAGNPLLVALDRLVEEGSLPAGALDDSPSFPPGRVDYARVVPWKRETLRASWRYMQHRGPAELRRALADFVEAPEQRGWLDNWALFSALREQFEGRSWVDWDAPLRRREAAAMRAARDRLSDAIQFHQYLQFQFFRQWTRVREAAGARGIRIMGDVPIYVAHDSADVWANPQYFTLREDGRPEWVAGVPPDYFSQTGQLWGNPLYDWKRLARDDYGWWIARLKINLRLVDALRLDHFRGFVAYWRIHADEETAVHGRWIRGPGARLFDAIRAELGELPFVAEDLGVITPPVRKLKRDLGLPGMKVLQFGFGDARSPHRPDRLQADDVVYTGTHDNDTTRGWFMSLGEDERRRVREMLQTEGGKTEGEKTNGEEIVWKLMRAAFRSPAALAVVPLQDVLDLDSSARMNTPAVRDGNWAWQALDEQLDQPLAARLRRLAEETERV